MYRIKKAAKPFRFYTRLTLRELTGKEARDLRELVELIKEVPGSAIFYHTHIFLQENLRFVCGPANEFACWINEVLHEEELGEQLASIEICDFDSIRQLRENIIEIIERFFSANAARPLRTAQEGSEFRFYKSHSFILPTAHIAHNLAEFAKIIRIIGANSLYFHMFEARLRLELRSNDFSVWLKTSLGANELAKKIGRLDPYTYGFEQLQRVIVNMVEGKVHSPFSMALREER